MAVPMGVPMAQPGMGMPMGQPAMGMPMGQPAMQPGMGMGMGMGAQPGMVCPPVGAGMAGMGAMGAMNAMAGMMGGMGMEQRCFKCEGRGFAHESTMPHDKAPHEKCFFCKPCKGCDGKGHIPGGMGGMMGGMMGGKQRCFKCE